MTNYLVMHNMVGEFPQGREVTVEELGGAANLDRLIKLGAIEEASGAVAAVAAAVAPAASGDGPPSPSLTTGQPGGAVGTGVAPDPLAIAVGDAAIADKLRAAGFGTPEQIGAATDEQLRGVGGIGEARLAKLREYARLGL